MKFIVALLFSLLIATVIEAKGCSEGKFRLKDGEKALWAGCTLTVKCKDGFFTTYAKHECPEGTQCQNVPSGDTYREECVPVQVPPV